MPEIIKMAEDAARRLHEKVPYGKGSNMYAQVQATAQEIFANVNSNERSFLFGIALLHKSRGKKRIIADQEPLSDSYIERYFSEAGVKIIRELASEPDDIARREGESDYDYQMRDAQAKAEWAKGLSSGAKKILLAEKLANFKTSLENPNPKWNPEKHATYYISRMTVAEAIKDIDADTKRMYNNCVHRMKEGLNNLCVPVPSRYAEKFPFNIFMGKGPRG